METRITVPYYAFGFITRPINNMLPAITKYSVVKAEKTAGLAATN
jgi:hypothetical protein